MADSLENYAVMFPDGLFFRMAEQRRDRTMCQLLRDESSVTESEIKYVRDGVLGIVKFLYENGKARLIDLDFGVGKIVGSWGECFGSPDIAMLTDFMKECGIVGENSYPYRFRLSSKYERAFDLLFMQRIFS